MKRQTNMAGYTMILAAIGFWMSWFLMPDPGTTDAEHILRIVKEARTSVLASVTIQIISSVLYIFALFPLSQGIFIQKKLTRSGLILFGIGVLGLCSDAFFHLLAYYMTDNTVAVQEDVIAVMTFMQTKALVFLVPLLLPFFVGSALLAVGLYKQGVISRASATIMICSVVIGGIIGVISNALLNYQIPSLALMILSFFSIGQTMLGYELSRLNPGEKLVSITNKSNVMA